jgi:hypothetical protein
MAADGILRHFDAFFLFPYANNTIYLMRGVLNTNKVNFPEHTWSIQYHTLTVSYELV